MAVRARYADIVIDPYGNALAGASVAVYQAGTILPITETIYAYATTGTTLTNPLTTDANGRFAFYLALPKRVDLAVSKTNYDSYTLTNVDVIVTEDIPAPIIPADMRVMWGPASGFRLGTAVWSDDAGYYLDDADDKACGLFCIEKGGSITGLGFKQMKTNGIPPNYAVSIQTLDGNGKPSGANYGGSAPGLYVPGANGWKWVDFATPATAVVGDKVAVVVGPGGATGVNYISVQYHQGDWLEQFCMPAGGTYTTSWNVTSFRWPAIVPHYSDGSAGQFFPMTNGQSENYRTGSAPNEVGCLFQVPFKCVCSGARVQLSGMTGGSNNTLADIILYDATGAILGQNQGLRYAGLLGGGWGGWDVFWAAPVTLEKNTNYRLGIKATSASLYITLLQMTFVDAASRVGMPESARWQRTSRTGAGAWTEDALALPMCGLWLTQLVNM